MIFTERLGKREVQNIKTHTRTGKLYEVLFKQEVRSSNRTEKK